MTNRRATPVTQGRVEKEATDGFRLSPQQRHLWRLHQSDGGHAYVAQCVVRIEGPWRHETLRAALKDVIQQHEILRTRYVSSSLADLPKQVIDEDTSLRLDEHRLPGSDAQAFEARCDEVLKAFVDQARQLGERPPVRFSLVTDAAGRSVLLISAEALSMDAPGLDSLVGQVCRSYQARSKNERYDVEPLQYADLAEWQNELLESDETAAGRAFWEDLDLAVIRDTKLPPFPRPADSGGFAPRLVPLTRGADLQRILAVSQRYDVPVSAVLLTAWQILLGRLTGPSEMVIAVGCDGRNQEDLEESLGLFERYLPLTLAFDEDVRFVDALQKIKDAAERAAKRQGYFSWELLAESADNRPEPFSPIAFDFSIQPPPRKAGDVTFAIDELNGCTDRFAIRLSCIQNDDAIAARLHFDPDRYAADDIRRLGAQFNALLDDALARPECQISELVVLSDQERQQVAEWNDGERLEFPQEACLHELIEQNARQSPDCIAVVQGAQQITYQQLNASANQLARHLRDLGVDRETLVGICVNRSLEMAVALVAIAKAGGAYLPMDPAYPPERLRYMLDDSRVTVLLTQQQLADSIPESDATIVLVDAADAAFRQYESTTPVTGVMFDNLSYVIYTSGSTGKPKGVMLNHQGRVNNFLDFNRRFSIGSGDRIIALASLSFDMCAYDMFGTLAAGATIVMPLPEEMQEPRAWADRINNHMVSIWHTAPAMLQMLVDHLESHPEQAPRSLRLALLGGDWIPVTLPDRLRSLVNSTRFISMGGATECSMDSTIYEVLEADPNWKSIPYGLPMKNQRSYVLDVDFDEVPFGVPGELYLGGIGVGRGYFRRPDFTAQRFVPDPYVDQPGARMYRTGDLAQWMPDGNLELLGRMDHQVKIRGYRIELGEIESVLRRHDAVREAVVVARNDERGDKMLVAYVVTEPGSANVIPQLRGLAKEKLPDYMVPSAYVTLDSLPLTPNGKVDRKSLPAPDASRPDLEAHFVEPRTAAEEKLARIWSDVLRVDRVGAEDNFFELGGHSLLATQVVSRIRSTFDIDLPLRSLFEAPTVAGLARLVQAAGGGSRVQIPTRGADESDLRLSFAQERLWFLDQLTPGGSAYNIPYAGRFRGPLNAASFEQVLREVLRRHESLRTCFPVLDGRPHQAIGTADGFRLRYVDLSGLPAGERVAQRQRLAAAESQRSFDLTKGPLVRATLLRLEDQEHAILLTMHHVVSDGWSLGVLSGEISALYELFASGQPSQLPELPIQYADYAIWQRRWLDGSALEAQLAYWKGQLVDASPSLNLPTDRPRPAIQTFQGANQSIVLPEALTADLKALSQREGATLFMTLMAAFQTLLHRYTGDEDVLVGTPIAGRSHAEVEGLIGFFVNTLVMRADVSGDPSFRRLLGQVRETALEAYAHQDLPFETLVDTLNVARDLSRTPLFQVVFSLDSAAQPTLELPALKYHPLATENRTAKFDLIFNLSERRGGLSGSLEYNTDLFDGSTIERMLEHFQRLLQGIVSNPEQRVSELPLLSQREREQLVEWNATDAAFPENACVHELVEGEAEKSPDALALSCAGRQLSYRELNARANQLARHLRDLGVGPEAPVGIVMERSATMIEGMLGVLKAGGAYLPLDPDAPAERLQFMIGDAAVHVVLTVEDLKSRLPLACRAVSLDGDWTTISKKGKENLGNRADAANLAYVIYTSGSTGRPKGVGVSHRGLCNLVAWHRKAFSLSSSNRATQIAAPTFDASVWEIWPYLSTGASLHIPDDVTRSSPPDLAAWLASENVTHTFMPTPLAEEVLQGPWPASTSLEFFLTGGDELRRVPKTTLPFRLTNQYGPTENTVVATWTPVETSGLVDKAPPIGRPIDNVRVHVLDRYENSVPIGVSGELYMGGSSLSRGYVSRADLTADRFVPDPFSTKPGARLYRSGDLCRFLPEGDLEFRGRRDHQVKIRGFRIELGEIEAALTAHPEVREVVVLARADGAVARSGAPAKRLVAYVVAERQPGPDSPALRAYLKERLPDYMVPAAFVMLDALPLTPNGKLDRKALPSPTQIRPEAADDLVLPRSDRERVLAEIWSHVLHVDRIGVHDNFFELGGDSILSIQIVAKANQAGLRLTPKDIFQYQTVAELAQMAGSAPAIEAEQGLVTGPVPLTPIQRWFFDLELADPSHFNQAVLFELKQNVDPRLLQRAVESLLLHHDALRLRFRKEGQRWMQTGTDPSASVPFRSMDLSDLAPEQKRSALERTAADIQGGLDLSDGPLLQIALCDLGPGEHQRLLIVVHHLLVDGVSWRILLEDLQTAVDQLSQGRAVQLPAKTTSFARWAERLVQHAQSPAVDEESSLWFGVPRSTVNPLPVDFENGENTGASSEAVSVSLSVEETEALLREIPEVYHTEINDVLLTAVAQAFATWTSDSALLLDLEGHGREPIFEDVDVSRTVGWFTTIYPVLLHIEPDSSPGDALRSIKEQLRAIPNRGLNYGVLRYLKDSRQAADTAARVRSLPLPEVSFNYLGQFDQSLAERSNFSVARESSGPVYGPHNRRPWLLQVDGYVQESQLRLAFVFSKNVHRSATIEHLAHEVLHALQTLISHCLSPDAGGFTPSDFPLASLDAKKLGRLAEKLASADARSRN